MNQINSKQIIQNSMYDFIGIKTNRTQPNDTVIDEKLNKDHLFSLNFFHCICNIG